jgi:hypothetical protein
MQLFNQAFVVRRYTGKIFSNDILESFPEIFTKYLEQLPLLIETNSTRFKLKQIVCFLLKYSETSFGKQRDSIAGSDLFV